MVDTPQLIETPAQKFDLSFCRKCRRVKQDSQWEHNEELVISIHHQAEYTVCPDCEAGKPPQNKPRRFQ